MYLIYIQNIFRIYKKLILNKYFIKVLKKLYKKLINQIFKYKLMLYNTCTNHKTIVIFLIWETHDF